MRKAMGIFCIWRHKTQLPLRLHQMDFTGSAHQDQEAAPPGMKSSPAAGSTFLRVRR